MLKLERSLFDQFFRTFEHVDVPVPQILKGTAKDVVEVEFAPHERVQQQTVEMPMPQIFERDSRGSEIVLS